jgi:hypothetical protein
MLAPLVEPLPVRRFAGLDPGFAKDGVLEAALIASSLPLRGFPGIRAMSAHESQPTGE